MDKVGLFFFTKEEKKEYIEKKADEMPSVPKTTIKSNVYLGINLSDVDTKERILKIIKTDGHICSLVTYEDNNLFSIETEFPELTKGEKFVDFIEENFPETKVCLEVVEECQKRFGCSYCSLFYNSPDEAVDCHIEDCYEQLIEEIDSLRKEKEYGEEEIYGS